METAGGEGHGPPCGLVPLPDVVEANRQVACGEDGIAAKASRQANVRVFTDDLDLRIAEVAGHSGADGNGYAGLHQLRGLLDVQFDKALD